MYSLTQATQVFLDKYFDGTTEEKSRLVKRYNAHKVRHTMWVLECGRMILLFMKQNWFYDEELFNASEMSFILHDIARAFQNDWEEILPESIFDHWTEWYKMLKEIWIYDDMINLSVKYHNKYSIDEMFNDEEYLALSKEDREKAVFIAKIIRDADKVQNMIYSIYNPNDFFFNLGDNHLTWPISKENFENIKLKKQLWRDYINTKIDVVISTFSRIFDINFKESFIFLNSFNYYDEMIKILKSLEWCDDKLIAELDKYYKPQCEQKNG